MGVDEATATNAVPAALPTLLGGLQAKATEPVGAASVVGALDQHGELVEGEDAVDVDKVDVADRSKIVDEVFGEEKNTVIGALGATVGNDLVAKLLPMLALIVMAYLAEQMTSGSGGTAAPQTQSGGGIGDILGGSGKSGGTIGEALARNAGSALRNVLGGLFWGKR